MFCEGDDELNTKEVALITGVSVRTLHHYDSLGLLRPSRNSENGYRDYSSEDLDLLQQILFFRECGFHLAKIKMLLGSPSFDREKAFELQKKYLLNEKKRIETMLTTLEKSIKTQKGEIIMTPEEKFIGFDFKENPYEEEARRLWGDEAVDKSSAYIGSMSEKEQKDVGESFNELFRELAAVRTEPPTSDKAQKAMDKMFRYFNQNLGCKYSPEAFAGLGRMYVEDSRFTENIDKFGEGLSAFLAEAMDIYAKNIK